MNALYTDKNDDTLVRYGTDTVTKAGINRLKPKSWLKDDVMTFYFKLIMKRDEELSKKKPKRKKCTFFSSFFFSKLFENNKYSYKGVKNWVSKMRGRNNLFELDKVFFIVNLGNYHWSLVIVSIPRKKITTMIHLLMMEISIQMLF